jgi:GNAT superfamily N-acetyltransferase
MKRRVCDSRVHGVLAFVDDKPAGWCAVDPREEIPGHDVPSAGVGNSAPGTWAIHCVWVRPEFRRQGIARALIEAAAELANRVGARSIEAYPAEPGQGLDFTGPPRIFGEQGFDVRPGVLGPFGLATLIVAREDP